MHQYDLIDTFRYLMEKGAMASISFYDKTEEEATRMMNEISVAIGRTWEEDQTFDGSSRWFQIVGHTKDRLEIRIHIKD